MAADVATTLATLLGQKGSVFFVAVIVVPVWVVLVLIIRGHGSCPFNTRRFVDKNRNRLGVYIRPSHMRMRKVEKEEMIERSIEAQGTDEEGRGRG